MVDRYNKEKIEHVIDLIEKCRTDNIKTDRSGTPTRTYPLMLGRCEAILDWTEDILRDILK